MAHVWESLKTADRTQGHLFLSYGWAVRADWSGDGLSVEAYSLDDPYVWNAAYRFLSR